MVPAIAFSVAAIALAACSQSGFSLTDRSTSTVQITVSASTPPAVGPLLSERSVPVPTTDPTTATTMLAGVPEPTSTLAVDLNPVLPRLGIDPIFDGIHDRLASVITFPVRLPQEVGESTAVLTPAPSLHSTATLQRQLSTSLPAAASWLANSAAGTPTVTAGTKRSMSRLVTRSVSSTP